MELDLKELYLLLSIHDRRGYININNFAYGFAAVTLLELTLMGKIKINNSKVVIVNHRKTGDVILDRILDRIKKSNNPKRVSQWIFRISYKVSWYKKETLIKLERKRIIHIETRRFLRLIPFKRYPISNRLLKKSIIVKLLEVVNGKIPEKETLIQYAMVYSTGLIPIIFKGHTRKTARIKFEELLENDKTNSQVMEITKLIRRSIRNNSRGQI
ncbi:GPP34 family phosphoprotein [candidate division KSB1 bacterium]